MSTCARRAALLGAVALSTACTPLRGPWSATPPPTPDPALVYDAPVEIAAPEMVLATAGQYREIPLRWDPVLIPGVAGYVVESALGQNGPFQPRVVLRDRGALAWVDRGAPEAPLEDGATRFYRVRTFAHDGRVSSLVSEVTTASTAPLPEPPTGLRAFSRQPRSVPLSWNASADPIVAGYTVERSPRPDGPFEVVAELEGRHSTHVLDTGLDGLRVLYYRVSSRNPGGQRGAPTKVLRAVTKPAPLPPISLHVIQRRLGAIALAWEPNVETDLRGYLVRRWREGGMPELVAYVDATRTRAEDPGVSAERTYFYSVAALDRDGLESRTSHAVRVESVGYEWTASASPGEIRLRWNPRIDEGFVRARVTRSGRLWRERIFLTESAELVDRDVTPGRQYRYRIGLERANGETAPPSRPIEIAPPRAGFVEIQAPTSRLPQPEGIPR